MTQLLRNALHVQLACPGHVVQEYMLQLEEHQPRPHSTEYPEAHRNSCCAA